MGLIIVTDAEIIEKFKLTKGFINRHSRQMGSFSRNPRKFILSRVEQYIENLSAQNAAKDSPEMKKFLRKQQVDRMFQESVRTVKMKKLRRAS